MDMKRSPARFSLPLLGLALSLGCNADAGPGSLVVAYRLSSGISCEDAGVDRVRVFLDDGEDYDREANCVEGDVEFDDVDAGNYDVTIEGSDIDGDVIMDNIDDDTSRSVEVLGDGTETLLNDAVLGDTPGILQIQWDFGAQNCDLADIDSFSVEAYEWDGFGGTPSRLMVEDLDCNTAEPVYLGYRQLEDADREVDGDLFGRVRVQARDDSGQDVGPAVLFDFEPRGAGKTVRTTIECEVGGCTSDGEPD
jgi:hypothetical protein